MKNKSLVGKISVLILSLLVIASMVGCGNDSVNDNEVETYSVSGTVLDNQDNPINGVTLLIAGSSIDNFSIDIVDNGNWSATELKGEVVITPAKEDWGFDPTEITVTKEDDGRENIYFIGQEIIHPGPANMTPVGDAVGVEPDAQVSIEFNQDVTELDLSGLTITTDSGSTILAGVSGSLTERTISITHDDFEFSKNYTITIPASAVENADSIGNSEISWSFTIRDAVTAPGVINLTPGENAIDVERDASVSIEFNQDVTEVDLSGVSITPDGGSELSDISANLSGITLTIDHTANFNYGVTYTVMVPAGAVENNDGVANELISWSFTTRTATAPPTVSTLIPVDSSPAVEPDAQVSIEFNQDVTAVDLSGISITTDSGSTVVAGVGSSLTDRTISIVHDDFEYSKIYTVIIPASAVENADSIVNSEISWSFTVRDALPVPEPVSLDPQDGATGVAVNKNPVISFDDTVSLNSSFHYFNGNIEISDQDGNIYQVTSVSQNPLAIEIGHSTQTFPFNSTITVNIAANLVLNEDGIGNESFSWSFTTEQERAASIEYISKPVNGTAGEVLPAGNGGNPTVRVLNQLGQPMAGVPVTVVAKTLIDQNNYPEVNFDSGTTTLNTSATGEACFDDLVLNEGTNYFLSFNSGSVELPTVDTQYYYYDYFNMGFAGSGTEVAPYLIHNIYGLRMIRDNLAADYRLENDINAAGTQSWNNGQGWYQLGYYSTPFTGILDGNNYSINGLYSNDTGLFYYLEGTVRDLKISNADFTSSSTTGILAAYARGASIDNVSVSGTVGGGSYVGGLIGSAYNSDSGQITNIINCQADVTVTASIGMAGGLVGVMNEGEVDNCSSSGTIEGPTQLGGLVGQTGAIITNSSSDVDVICTGDYAGGLTGESRGYSGGYLSNCTASGDVSGQSNVGGLSGSISSNSITDCTASGNVTTSGARVGGLIGRMFGANQVSNSTASGVVSGSNNVGGLIGYIDSQSSPDILIEGCLAEGSVSGLNQVGGLIGHVTENYGTQTIQTSSASGTVSGDTNVGGLIGKVVSTTVSKCSTTSNVNATGSYVGGFAGYNEYSNIDNSYARGGVNGADYVGGFAGYSEGGSSCLLTNSYSTGSVTTLGSTKGGFLGYNNGVIISSYYDTQTSGCTDSDKGTPETTANMKLQATFIDWDFATIWAIDGTTNDGYPYLR